MSRNPDLTLFIHTLGIVPIFFRVDTHRNIFKFHHGHLTPHTNFANSATVASIT